MYPNRRSQLIAATLLGLIVGLGAAALFATAALAFELTTPARMSWLPPAAITLAVTAAVARAVHRRLPNPDRPFACPT